MCSSQRRAMKALGPGQVQIGSINRDHLHHGRILCQESRDAVAPFRVEIVVAVQKYGVRAQAPRGAQRHRRMNAILPGLVARRGYHAARSEEHTSELQSLAYLVCRLLLEKKKITSTSLPRQI